jgi:hypothetical protein
MTAATSQDLIGWTEFLLRKISVNIEAIQQLHCSLHPCRITGSDWMKAMSSHLMQILHSQWIFWNFTLHDKQRGYLQLKQHRDLLREVDFLLNTLPDKIPKGSRYLLELDYSTIHNASFECQSYWVLAMKASRRAKQCTAVSSRQKGRAKRCAATHRRHSKPRYGFTNDNTQIRWELGLQASN